MHKCAVLVCSEDENGQIKLEWRRGGVERTHSKDRDRMRSFNSNIAIGACHGRDRQPWLIGLYGGEKRATWNKMGKRSGESMEGDGRRWNETKTRYCLQVDVADRSKK